MTDLVSKPGTKSIVWDYFGLKKGANGEIVDDGTATCRSCRKAVQAKQGNTSNLLAHMRIHHGRLHAEVTALMKSGKQQTQTRRVTEKEQPTIEEVIETAQTYERGGKKWKELTESVTYFLARDGQPMYTVEKPGFRKMLIVDINLLAESILHRLRFPVCILL